MVSYSTDAYRWQYLVDRYGNQKVGTSKIDACISTEEQRWTSKDDESWMKSMNLFIVSIEFVLIRADDLNDKERYFNELKVTSSDGRCLLEISR